MKRNAKHTEVLSGATFHRANTERGAKTQAAVYAGNGQRSKVAQHGGKWGCWVWPKSAHNKYPTVKNKKEALARRKKCNPEAGAVAMRESFTGLPSKKTITVTEDVHVHEHLAALGELVQLKVKTLKGVIFTIGFGKEENPKKGKPIGKKVAGWVDRRAKAVSGIADHLMKTWVNPKKINPNGAPILAVTEDGKNLMIVGGSQALDLKALGMGEFADKESVIVGDIKTIDYFATKDWKDGKKPETAIYTHKMGEETGDLPLLRYDTRNKRCFIDGGRYHIKRPMLGTSPGIEN